MIQLPAMDGYGSGSGHFSGHTAQAEFAYAAAVDDHLDDRAFIVPGRGDAGDRLFGTA